MASLFRQQAVDSQSQRLVGAVSLAQPLSIKLTVALIALVVFFVLLFLFNAEYARKETVSGFLRPDKGVIKSYSKRQGTISRVLVEEGQKVSKGDLLVTIVSRQHMQNGEELNDKQIGEIRKKLTLLDDEAEQLTFFEKEAMARLSAQKLATESAIAVVKNQQTLMREKLDLLKSQQKQFNKLLKLNHISSLEFQQQQERLLTVKQELETLSGNLINQENRLAEINFDILKTPQQYVGQARELNKQRTDLTRLLNETETNHSHTIRATHSGTVTSIQVVEGQTLNASRPLLTIVPEGATLIAELLLPTRSAGFVEVGDIARLRFEAFPHQRFGFMESNVLNIEKTLITQNDVDFPVALSEPVYRLQANLSQQAISGYGQVFALKSGMLFQADIILDKRSLIDWLLDPIYSLRGRIG